MIQFEKINELQAHIKYNGKTVGYLEKLIDCYILELFYSYQVLTKDESPYIKEYIKNQIALNERRIESEYIHKKRGFTVHH